MRKTNEERQKKFKEKMYRAGLKQSIIWIERKRRREIRMTRREFVKTLEKLTAGWDETRLSRLYNLLVMITRGKKEADRHKR